MVDYEDCCCADVFSDGEIVVRFEAHSEVPHKMKVGGQSAKRFAQIRDNEIVKWFKRINEYMKAIEPDRQIYLGISEVYLKRFMSYLSTYNKQKIKERRPSAYAARTGIYDLLNTLEREKK